MIPLAPLDQIPPPTAEVKPSPNQKVRGQLASPQSKSSARLSAFLNLKLDFPHEFPCESSDPGAIERLRWVLGFPQLSGSTFKEELYTIKGKRAFAWFVWMKEKIGPHVLEEYLVGSSVGFISGKSKLIEGLELLKPQLPQSLFQDTLRKLEKWDGSFKDVDFKLKVKDVNLETLAKELNAQGMVKARYFADDNTLIVNVIDDNGHGVDFFIYTDREDLSKDDHALNTDNWRIDLKKTFLLRSEDAGTVQEKIQFESSRAWQWWQGQVFQLIVKKESTNRYLFLRLVDREVRSHTALEGTETIFFKACNINVYQPDGDVSVRALLRRLRIQQIALEHQKQVKISYLLNQTSQVNAEVISNRFLKTIFCALNEKRDKVVPYMHAIIECIALVALCEGWDKPSVKLVRHEGKWYMRMRIEGCDLLLPFNPKESLGKLPKADSEMWHDLKKVMHALLRDGIQLRHVSNSFNKEMAKHIDSKLLIEIKQHFLHGVHGVAAVKFFPPQHRSLASYLIPLCSDPKELLWLGLEVLSEYDSASKQKLCWLAVENCLKYKGFDNAAELIVKLRENEIDPEDGYGSFFMTCLRGNCNDAVLKACNPMSIELKWPDLAKPNPPCAGRNFCR